MVTLDCILRRQPIVTPQTQYNLRKFSYGQVCSCNTDIFWLQIHRNLRNLKLNIFTFAFVSLGWW